MEFMVWACSECNEVLRIRQDLVTGVTEFMHGSESTAEHDPTPVYKSAEKVKGVCDLCGFPNPVDAYVPSKRIIVNIPIFATTFDHSSPWAACERCSIQVKRRNLHLLLNGAMARLSAVQGLSKAHKVIFRRYLKDYYRAFFKSEPKGPYKVRE